jgi:hypothetical protein
MEFSDPLVLELVPNGDYVQPVLVTKCPPGVAANAETLNQRGHQAWPEITMWPHNQHWRHNTGGVQTIKASDSHSWSVRFWYQEAVVYARECREALIHAVDTLEFCKPNSRPKNHLNETKPREEDFGPEWSDELEAMKQKKDGWHDGV